jgi:hypothetical protein
MRRRASALPTSTSTTIHGVIAWASCPQKGVLSLPLTYAPVSFTDKAIDLVSGCYTYVHHGSSNLGILNQLTPDAITEITSRFADAVLAMGSEFDKQQVMNGLKSCYAKAAQEHHAADWFAGIGACQPA